MYQQIGVYKNYAAILQPFGWVSVIDLNDLSLIIKFAAYERQEFSLWLDVKITEDYIFTSMWSDQWQTKIFGRCIVIYISSY